MLSTQHDPSMNEKQKELAEAVIEEIAKPVFPKGMPAGTRILVNPTGQFGCGEPEFTWEATDRADALRAAAGLRDAAPARAG